MSNLWLNPALLPQARDAAAHPVSREPVSAAAATPRSKEAFIPDVRRAPRKLTTAPRPGRHASLRQLCLRAIAVALLGGSAAFSYLAWSDEMLAGGARSTPPQTNAEAAKEAGLRSASTAQVHGLRRENIALRRHIARLERAIDAVTETRQAKPAAG